MEENYLNFFDGVCADCYLEINQVLILCHFEILKQNFSYFERTNLSPNRKQKIINPLYGRESNSDSINNFLYRENKTFFFPIYHSTYRNKPLLLPEKELPVYVIEQSIHSAILDESRLKFYSDTEQSLLKYSITKTNKKFNQEKLYTFDGDEIEIKGLSNLVEDPNIHQQLVGLFKTFVYYGIKGLKKYDSKVIFPFICLLDYLGYKHFEDKIWTVDGHSTGTQLIDSILLNSSIGYNPSISTNSIYSKSYSSQKDFRIYYPVKTIYEIYLTSDYWDLEEYHYYLPVESGPFQLNNGIELLIDLARRINIFIVELTGLPSFQINSLALGFDKEQKLNSLIVDGIEYLYPYLGKFQTLLYSIIFDRYRKGLFLK